MLVLDAAPAKPREGVSKVEPGDLLTSDPEGVALPAAAKKGLAVASAGQRCTSPVGQRGRRESARSGNEGGNICHRRRLDLNPS